MGKATILIGISIFISMVALIVTLGIQSIEPNSPLLTSNALFGDFNVVYDELNTSGSEWEFTKNYGSTSYLPSREATGDVNADTSQFPDWAFSGWKWITGIMSVLLNCVGAPYTMAMMIFPGELASVIGAGLSLFNLFIIVGWILGKID
jgi:hypothetical protein